MESKNVYFTLNSSKESCDQREVPEFLKEVEQAQPQPQDFSLLDLKEALDKQSKTINELLRKVKAN